MLIPPYDVRSRAQYINKILNRKYLKYEINMFEIVPWPSQKSLTVQQSNFEPILKFLIFGLKSHQQIQCVQKVRLKSICLKLGLEKTLKHQRSGTFSTRLGHFDIYFPKHFKIIPLGLHGRPNGPLNGPCEAHFWHPW